MSTKDLLFFFCVYNFLCRYAVKVRLHFSLVEELSRHRVMTVPLSKDYNSSDSKPEIRRENRRYIKLNEVINT